MLKADYGDRLCIHTIKVGGTDHGGDLTAMLAAVNNCGSAENAASLASPTAMVNYVANTLLEALPAPAVEYKEHVITASVLFGFDRSNLTDDDKAAINSLWNESVKLWGSSVVSIDIIGHTDSIGSQEYNRKLSMRRAESVRDYMISKGVEASIINIYDEGESDPIANNENDEDRAENRRVYITITRPAD